MCSAAAEQQQQLRRGWTVVVVVPRGKGKAAKGVSDDDDDAEPADETIWRTAANGALKPSIEFGIVWTLECFVGLGKL